MNTKRIIFLGGLGFSIAFGVSAESARKYHKMEKGPSYASSVVCGIELRPSVRASDGGFYSENAVELGAKVSPKVQLSYAQEFSNNSFDNEEESGVDLKVENGFFRGKFNDILSSADNRSNFGYQLRTYIPTSTSSQERGMISILRNYFKFSRKFSNTVTLGLWEVPILHIYSEPGLITGSGTAKSPFKPESNPVFENRGYFVMDFSFAKGKINFSLPLILKNTRYRAFQADADNDDSWVVVLMSHPELTFNLSPNTYVGVAFESGSFVDGDSSGFSLNRGLHSGAGQLIFGVGL